MERLFSLSIREEGGTILKKQKTWLNGVTGRPCWPKQTSYKKQDGECPQTVNAYYNASYNEIVFQQLFYNRHFIITKQTKR
jgi:hypothetical protein